MKRITKLSALAASALLVSTVAVATTSQAAGACSKNAKPTQVSMLGTIKPEIKDQFLAAVADYNKSQKCYVVTSIPGDRNLTFLQNVTPMYAAKNPPTIMYTLQEIPNMADKVIDWRGTRLAQLVPSGLLAAAKIGGKQVGVPSTAEAFGLLYNKKVLDAAGVNPAAIKTRSDLEAAFKTLQAKGKKAIHFSAVWWSLGAHFTNIFHTDASAKHEGRLALLDGLSDGTVKLSSNPVFQNWLATFDLLKKYNGSTVNLGDTEYDASIADLTSGNYGFLFQGNWTEPNLLTATPGGQYGIMPLPISNDATSYGNDSIPVGVPGYFMVDNVYSSAEQKKGAIDFLTWLYTSPAGQHHVADPAPTGMGFIPVYKNWSVAPTTFMSQEIAKFVAANKTLEWINTYYPAGLQETVGKVSMQQYFTDKISAADLAKAIEGAWKGSAKTWRGAKA